MGTRADFYVGRGKSAEWIGSIAWDGYPSGICKQLLNCTGEGAYRHAVGTFLADREDRSLPEDGWPWPWDDSSVTDLAYAFDGEKVHATWGDFWFDPTAKCGDDDPKPSSDMPVEFPDMSHLKRRPTFGKHSGVMLITSAPAAGGE